MSFARLTFLSASSNLASMERLATLRLWPAAAMRDSSPRFGSALLLLFSSLLCYSVLLRRPAILASVSASPRAVDDVA